MDEKQVLILEAKARSPIHMPGLDDDYYCSCTKLHKQSMLGCEISIKILNVFCPFLMLFKVSNKNYLDRKNIS